MPVGRGRGDNGTDRSAPQSESAARNRGTEFRLHTFFICEFPGPQVFAGADAAINIPALGIDLPLLDIYVGIDFD